MAICPKCGKDKEGFEIEPYGLSHNGKNSDWFYIKCLTCGFRELITNIQDFLKWAV